MLSTVSHGTTNFEFTTREQTIDRTGRGGLGMGLGDAPGNSQDTGWFAQGEKIDLLAGTSQTD